MRPSDEDNLERVEGEPLGHHVREKTEEGYPLMGSSPAERVEALERGQRIKRQAMRDHPFEGEGRYCQHWRVLTDRMTGAGRLVMRDQCGYGRDTHPSTPSDLASMAARRLADHLKDCRQVDAAVVVDGNADELVAKMLAEGWTFEGSEHVEGKRVRYLVPPPGWMPEVLRG